MKTSQRAVKTNVTESLNQVIMMHHSQILACVVRTVSKVINEGANFMDLCILSDCPMWNVDGYMLFDEDCPLFDW